MGGDPVEFERTGLRVMRSAVDARTCERVRESLQSWGRRHPEPRARLEDAWRSHRPVRELACHPGILDTLEGLYGRRAIPFQTLNFVRGSEQRLHADSVHFDSVPSGWMCGVWVALEDIGPGQGPLVVVPGSHRVAPSTFAGCFDGTRPFEVTAYEQALERDLSDFPAEEFHASTGDAVIWHADLAHGGATVADPSSSRWSQVTHYFFEGFTYVTPMLGDPLSGDVYLREPLVDISTGRTVRHRTAGHRARLVRLPGGRTRLLGGREPLPSARVRASSVLRGFARRSRRRGRWLADRVAAAVQQPD